MNTLSTGVDSEGNHERAEGDCSLSKVAMDVHLQSVKQAQDDLEGRRGTCSKLRDS